jgi:hypothetical protein
MLRFPAAAQSKWADGMFNRGFPRRAPGGDLSAKFNNKFRNLINKVDERHEGFGLAHEMSGGDIL